MKPTLCCLFLILIPMIANADTIGDQLNHVKQQLNTDYEKRTGYVQARSILKSQLDSINFAVDAYKKHKDTIFLEMNNLNVEIAETNHEAEVHNGHRCTFTLDNPGNCAEYDAETKRIEKAHAAARRKEQPIEVEKNQLDTIRQSITSDTEAWDLAIKKNDADYNDNEKEIGILKMTLERLKHRYDDCIQSQQKHRFKKTHEACGELFDGNIVHPDLGQINDSRSRP